MLYRSVVVLIGTLLAVVRPLAVGGHLLLHLADGLAGPIEADRKSVWFDDQLGLAHLWKVADDFLLALDVLLVLLCAVGHLLWRGEEGMEKAKIGA